MIVLVTSDLGLASQSQTLSLSHLEHDAGVAKDQDQDGHDGRDDEVGPDFVVMGVGQVAGPLRFLSLDNRFVFHRLHLAQTNLQGFGNVKANRHQKHRK